MSIASALPSRIPPSSRLSDDEVGGLRLVGALPGGVRLVGVGLDDLPSPRRCLARYGLLHREKTCRWSTALPRQSLDNVGEVC